MTGRFSRGEAAAIFGVLLFCCLAFFLLGVLAGRTFFVPTAPDPVASLEQPPPTTPQDLDFYSGLVDSGEEDSKDSKDPQPPADEGSSAAAGEPVPIGPSESGGEPADDPSETQTAAASQEPPPAASSFWTVQVGALDTADEARGVILRLEAKGYSARMVDPSEGGGRFYRVWVGEFRDESAARRFEERLKADGFHTYAKRIESPGGR